MNSKKQNSKTKKKLSKTTNHRAKSGVQTGSRSGRTKRKSSESEPKSRVYRKITDERKPFVFERVAAGLSCIKIAEEFGEEYELIDHSTINHFLRDHPEEYKEWQDRNFKEDIRLSNRKARLAALQHKADLLSRKIRKILREVPVRQFGEASLGLLLKEYREYIDQIRDESGDKKSSEGGDGKPTFILQVYNSVPGVLSNVHTSTSEGATSRLGPGK